MKSGKKFQSIKILRAIEAFESLVILYDSPQNKKNKRKEMILGSVKESKTSI